MKLSINMLYKKILTAVFISSILFQLFIPVLIFENPDSTVKLPASITGINYFGNSENIIESSGKKFDRNNFNRTAEFNNYPAHDFVFFHGNFYYNILFHKNFKYAEDELIIRSFYASNFSLRSPPVCLS